MCNWGPSRDLAYSFVHIHVYTYMVRCACAYPVALLSDAHVHVHVHAHAHMCVCMCICIPRSIAEPTYSPAAEPKLESPMNRANMLACCMGVYMHGCGEPHE